eukprot:127489-Rhodomonas_salina.2
MRTALAIRCLSTAQHAAYAISVAPPSVLCAQLRTQRIAYRRARGLRAIGVSAGYVPVRSLDRDHVCVHNIGAALSARVPCENYAAICLGPGSALPGTDIAYPAISMLCYVRYWPSVWPYPPKSKTRKRIPGINCTEIVFSCI